MDSTFTAFIKISECLVSHLSLVESMQVLWHGMGDSCCESLRSVGAIKKLIEEKLGRLRF